MAVLNLFGFFVQGLFGSALLATVFMVFCIYAYGAWTKMGPMLSSVFALLYSMIILMVYYGGIVGGLMFLAVIAYFSVSVLPWISSMWER